MKNTTIGNRIRDERLKLHLTQEQFAEKANVSRNFISLIENGRTMSVDMLIKIANACGVSVDYLLSDVVTPKLDNITEQTLSLLSGLSEKERLFILNFIKQYIETTHN